MAKDGHQCASGRIGTEIVEAWPELPEAVRAGIVAMVRASLGDG
jgi:hypothetical protein